MKPDEIVFEVSEETAKVMDSITDDLLSRTEDSLAETSDKVDELRETLVSTGSEIRKQLADLSGEIQKAGTARQTELLLELAKREEEDTNHLQDTFQNGNTTLKQQLVQMQNDEKQQFDDILKEEKSGVTQVLNALVNTNAKVTEAENRMGAIHDDEQRQLEEIRSELLNNPQLFEVLATLTAAIDAVRQNQETLLQELQKVKNDVALLKLPYYQRQKAIKQQNAKEKLEENGEHT